MLIRSTRHTYRSTRWKQILLFLLMGIVALLMLSPVLWALSASLQNEAGVYQTPFHWIPDHLLFQNYVTAWTLGNLGGAFLTSVEVTLLYVPVHVFLCTLTGYVFAKLSFPGKNILFIFVLLTLLIPQEVTYFAVYDLVKELGWLNTPQGVALPFFYSGFGIFLMRQFALSIPSELIEAAKIDGCGNFRCFFNIALPLLESGMVGLGILALTFIWSEFAWSHLILSTTASQTLPTALYILNSAASDLNHVIGNPVLLAGGVITIVPVILLFLFFQRRFIESVSRVGIRG